MPKVGKRFDKPYTKNDLEVALIKIKDGMSINEASRSFKIPRGTLQNRIHGRTKKSVNCSGPAPFLSAEEEQNIVDWIQTNMKKGFPRRFGDIVNVVKEFLDSFPRENPFTDNMPGHSWYNSFLRRHPIISIRQPESVTAASANVSESDIRGWFKLVNDYFNENEYDAVLKDPTRVFNADETGFELCPKTGKVLAIKGYRNVYEVNRGNEKESITVLFTFSAAGDILKPLIVFPYKRIPNDIRESVPNSFAMDKSDTGWMTSEVFYDFIKNVFYPELVAKNVEFPVVLFVDGHKTHLSMKLSLLCSDLHIILVCLYPNATRIIQPADVSIFGPVKTYWKVAVSIWRRDYPDLMLTKIRVARILKIVIDNCITKECITNGFRTTGLYPFDANAIDYSKCLGKNSVKNDVAIDEVGTSNSNKDLANKDSNLTNAIDMKRFGEIVGDKKLLELSKFNKEEESCSIDFSLLRQIFTELNMPIVEHVAISDEITNEIQSTSLFTENLCISYESDLEDTSFEQSTQLLSDDIMEIEELENKNDEVINTKGGVINDKVKTTFKDHLVVPPTPERKRKKRNNRRKTSFIISSELYKMEEQIKIDEKAAKLNALEKRQTIRAENKAKRLQLLDTKKQQQLETRLKKAAERLEKEQKKIIAGQEKQQKKTNLRKQTQTKARKTIKLEINSKKEDTTHGHGVSQQQPNQTANQEDSPEISNPGICSSCGKEPMIQEGLCMSCIAHITHRERKKSFSCELCQLNFFRQTSLNRHIKKSHGSLFYKCSNTLCVKSFINRSSLESHKCRINQTIVPNRPSDSIVAKELTDWNRYACDMCKKIFYKLDRYVMHFAQKCTDQIMYECDDCSKLLSTKKALIRHFSYCRKVVGLHRLDHKPCHVCNRMFSTQKKLETHVNSRRRIFQTKEERAIDGFICDKCKKIFHNLDRLVMHVAQNCSEEITYQCDYCSKAFLAKSRLLHHFADQHKIDELKRELCYLFQKSFMIKGRLKKHLNTVHHKNVSKPLQCKYCNQIFSQQNGLNIHMKKFVSHESNKKYAEYLTKSTGQNFANFSCDICGCSFLQKSYIVEHMLLVHSKKNLQTKKGCSDRFGIDKFSCSICNKSFQKQDLLRRHIRRMHDRKCFVCDICNQKFLSEKLYAKHRTVRRCRNKIQCVICSKIFAFKSGLARHSRHCNKKHDIVTKILKFPRKLPKLKTIFKL